MPDLYGFLAQAPRAGDYEYLVLLIAADGETVWAVTSHQPPTPVALGALRGLAADEEVALIAVVGRGYSAQLRSRAGVAFL